MSNTVRIPGGQCNHCHIDLILTETGTSVTNNTSAVSWQLVGYLDTANSAYWYSEASNAIQVVINGSTVFSRANTDTSVLVSIGTSHTISSPLIIASGSVTISHNSDGTKNCPASFYFKYRYDSSKSWSQSGGLVLTDIARKSTYSRTGNTTNNKITFVINRYSSSFKHTLTWSCGNQSGTITSNTSATTIVWTPPNSIFNQFPSEIKHACTITLTTLLNGTSVGSNSETFNLWYDDDAAPSISNKVLSAVSSNSVVNSWGKYVIGYSKIKAVITAAGVNGSTISSYQIMYSGTTTSSTSNTVTSSNIVQNVQTVGIKVIDSRGRSKLVTTTIAPVAYSKPYLSELYCFRCIANGTESDDGTCVKISAKQMFSSVGGSNKAHTTYQILKKTDSSSVTSGTLVAETTESSTGMLVIASLSATISYIVKVKITDLVGNTYEYQFTISTANIEFNLYPSKLGGAALGKYAEYEQCLDIGDWDFRCGDVKSTKDIVAGLGTTNQVSLQAIKN